MQWAGGRGVPGPGPLGALGRPWGLLGALGPSLASLAGFCAVLRGSGATVGDSWALLEGSWRPVDSCCSTLFIYIYTLARTCRFKATELSDQVV